MSKGDIGNGLSYFASISISGELNAKELQKVKAQIEKILHEQIDGKPVKGKIENEVRASSKATFDVNFSP
jgi:hypothetical protein